MPGSFDPIFCEEGWYSWWEEKKFFHADAKKVLSGEKKPYVMMLPPPNVTGRLHLGHGLMLAVEDLIAWWKWMSGYETLWCPGLDHAGISCQTVVENKVWKEEHKTRHDYGWEPFVNKIWEWKKEYGDFILDQSRRYAVSLDWDWFMFTLDDKNVNAVQEAFVWMYEKGIIYWSTWLVNWCCGLNTALSDIEVDKEDLKEPKKLWVPVPNDPKIKDKEYEFGYFTNFIYKIKGSERTIEIATTRLETMLGDVAVAVHPDDPRY